MAGLYSMKEKTLSLSGHPINTFNPERKEEQL